MSIPTEQEVLEYFKSLSNWGRWGDDDQLGTPNLITPEKTKKAIATVQEGVTVSLSRTVLWDPAPDVPNPPVHYMVESGEGWASGQKVSARPNAAATDYIGMIFHGYAVTHVDSLAHFFWDGKTYMEILLIWYRPVWVQQCAQLKQPKMGLFPEGCW